MSGWGLWGGNGWHPCARERVCVLACAWIRSSDLIHAPLLIGPRRRAVYLLTKDRWRQRRLLPQGVGGQNGERGESAILSNTCPNTSMHAARVVC